MKERESTTKRVGYFFPCCFQDHFRLYFLFFILFSDTLSPYCGSAFVDWQPFNPMKDYCKTSSNACVRLLSINTSQKASGMVAQISIVP
jgi:hypothetical protein